MSVLICRLCDVFVGLSGSALHSGRIAQSRGAKYVCDRGSSHIRTQDQLLREEHERWGVKFSGIDPRVVAREEAEYAASDRITVPSIFNVRSFVDRGFPAERIVRIPYGVNLDRFSTHRRNRPLGSSTSYLSWNEFA